MPRIRLYDRVRLPDGSVTTANDALKDGTLIRRPIWRVQWNQNAGNILGYRPNWKTETGSFAQIATAASYLRANSKGYARDDRCRLVRRVTIATPDGTRDYGFVSQTILKATDLDAAIAAYTEPLGAGEANKLIPEAVA